MIDHCSIVIRAYNEARHISRLLDGIARQTLSEPEIILVDSGSTDGTAAIAAKRSVKILHIPPEEFSFGRSLNLGISAARHEHVVVASAHVYPVYPDWLERLLAPFSDPRVALTYGKQRGGESTKLSEQQVFARWYQDRSNLHQPHPFCNNANAALRRSLWEQHPYDENLTGLEDLSWARWALDQGHTIAYVSEAEVVHIHNETTTGVFNRYRREAMAYKRLFPSESFTFADFLQLLSSNISNDIQYAARSKSLWGNLAGIISFRWNQFWGTYQGYRHPSLITEGLRKTFYYPPGAQAHAETRAREIEPIRYGDKP